MSYASDWCSLAPEKLRFGYRRLQVLLQRGGEVANHKRVHRVYRRGRAVLAQEETKTLCAGGCALRQVTSQPTRNGHWILCTMCWLHLTAPKAPGFSW